MGTETVTSRTTGALTGGPLTTDGPGLLVMDVDSTLIEQEVIELIAEHAGSRDLVAEVTARAMRGELDFASSLRERVATFQGLPVQVLDKVRAQVVPTTGAQEMIEALHRRGCVVGVVSGGFEEVVLPLAQALGIDHVAANRLEVQEGHLTGRVLGRVVDGTEKLLHLQAWAAQHQVPLERTVAVGDGANDLAMITAAGLGVAFCAKPVVRAQAPASVNVRDLRAVLELF